MEIAKFHELNLNHHHNSPREERKCQNLNFNNSKQEFQQDFQENNKQQQNGKWNQFTKSRLRSPTHQYQQNNKNHLKGPDIILTHNIGNIGGKDTKVSYESTEYSSPIKIKVKEACHENDDLCHGHGPENTHGLEYDDNKLNVGSNSGGNTSWNRIFQCFGVFKPRKISSSMNLNTTSTSTATNNLLKPQEQQQAGLRRTMTDLDLYLTDLADGSEILSRTDTKNLSSHFPPRSIGNSWEKTFTSTKDGFSLHNLYRKLDGIDSPVLFVIEDIEKRVFGAVLSCAFKVSENFYGNSDTFLFRCRPEFEVFKWSGDNLYFIQGQDGFISVGSDDGKYGLWLDDNMYNGRTEKCSTFNSPALVPEKDFKIKTVECWTVGIV